MSMVWPWRRSLVVAAAGLLAFEVASAAVQAQLPPRRTWREVTPTFGAAPGARRNGAAVYDAVGRRLVIFGGIGTGAHLNDTWAFDLATSSWARLETRGTPPPARLGHDAAYDAQGPAG